MPRPLLCDIEAVIADVLPAAPRRGGSNALASLPLSEVAAKPKFTRPLPTEPS